jgi:hypothetical protein
VCGKSVSSPLTAPVIVRAWVECPECIEADAHQKTLDRNVGEQVAQLAKAVQ